MQTSHSVGSFTTSIDNWGWEKQLYLALLVALMQRSVVINCLLHLTLWEWSRKEQDSCYVRICTKCRSLEESINYQGSTKAYITENIE